MTTNHHTPISNGAPVDAITVNTPLGQLDNAIDTLDTTVSGAVVTANSALTGLTNLKNGADGFTQLNLAGTTTLTISSGVITVTRTRHRVDTEGSASYDDLDTINGGVAGDVLVLQSVTASRVVVVKHNTGNIFLNGFDVFLDNPRKVLTLMYDGTIWVLVAHPLPQVDRRQGRVTYFDGTNYLLGVSATSFGTASNVLDAESGYTQYLSNATTGSGAGNSSTLDTLYQPRHNPLLVFWFKTSSVVSGIRWYMGFRTPAIYAAGDNLPSTGVSFFGVRYSTVAGDSGFRPVSSNGTTQTVASVLATVTANTVYKVVIGIVNGVGYISINDSTPVLVTATMPSATTNMGWVGHLTTQENVAKAVLMRQIMFEVN